MYRDDYILRIVEQITKMVAEALKLNAKGDREGARAMVRKSYTSLLGVSPEAVASFTFTDTVGTSREGAPRDAGRLFILGKLLAAEGDILAGQADEAGSFEKRIMGLNLFLEAAASNGASGGRDDNLVPEIEALLSYLDEYQLPVETASLLLRYFEDSGEYSRAEDALFGMLDRAGPDVIELGLGFYNRLLMKSPDELASGGLPVDEVRRGMKELEDRKNSSG